MELGQIQAQRHQNIQKKIKDKYNIEVDIGADPTTWPLAKGIAGYTYSPLSYHNYVGAYYGYGFGGGYGHGGFGGYGYPGYGYSAYPWGGHNGYYNSAAHNPYRHFEGQGRYDLGRFTFGNRGVYRNNAEIKDNQAYLAHVATVAKHKQLSPSRQKKAPHPVQYKTFDDLGDETKVEIVVESKKGKRNEYIVEEADPRHETVQRRKAYDAHLKTDILCAGR